MKSAVWAKRNQDTLVNYLNSIHDAALINVILVCFSAGLEIKKYFVEKYVIFHVQYVYVWYSSVD